MTEAFDSTFINPIAAVVENKLVQPSKALQQTLQNELGTLYQTARENLHALQSDLAQTISQISREPLAALGDWQSRAVKYTDGILTEINEHKLPQLYADYHQAVSVLDGNVQKLLAELNSAGIETKSFLEALYAHPQKTSEQLYTRLATGLQNAGADAVQFSRQTAAEVSADVEKSVAAMQQLYQTAQAISTELLNAPAASAATLYAKLSAVLLDFYTQGIGLMLQLSHSVTMPSGWAL